MVFLGFSYPRPSNATFICVSILFCSCCGFSLVCKKLLFCRKNARGGSFLPHGQLDLLQFLNLRLFCANFRSNQCRIKASNSCFQSSSGSQEKIDRTQENCSDQKFALRTGKSVSSCRFLDRMNIGAKKKCYVGRSWMVLTIVPWFSYGFPMGFHRLLRVCLKIEPHQIPWPRLKCNKLGVHDCRFQRHTNPILGIIMI